jgi:hypothetical protein
VKELINLFMTPETYLIIIAIIIVKIIACVLKIIDYFWVEEVRGEDK